jgi:Spy/CpxP family protein refolding chaperone
MNDKHMRAWFVAFVVAVFAAGIGAGTILDRYLAPPPRAGRPPVPGAAGRPGPGFAPGPGVLTRRLATELQLTADQQKKVDEIFERRRGRLEQIRSEVRAKFDGEQRDLRDEIRKVLTPDQQKRFDKWLLEEPMPGMRGGGRGMGRGRGMGLGRGMPPGR